MNWESWAAFWAMGGYGFFVWGAYAFGAVLVVVEVLALRVRVQRAMRGLVRADGRGAQR